MSDKPTFISSRRAFFARSGVALGTGLASATAGATSLFNDIQPLQEQLARLQQHLATLDDKAAIRQLHQAYTSLVQKQAWEILLELFTDDAKVNLDGSIYFGKKPGIASLFLDQYGKQEAARLQCAYRQDERQQQDSVDISPDRCKAHATFHQLVQVNQPLQDDSLPARMARLQGMTGSTHWEAGRFEAGYQRVDGQWRIHQLAYFKA
jgi:hypothetical protein